MLSILMIYLLFKILKCNQYSGRIQFTSSTATTSSLSCIFDASKNGKYLIVECDPSNTRFFKWNGTNFISINTFTKSSNTYCSVSISDNGEYAVTSMQYQKVVIYKLNGGIYSQMDELILPYVFKAKMSGDGSIVFIYMHETSNRRIQIYRNNGVTLILLTTKYTSSSSTVSYIEASYNGSIIIYNQLNYTYIQTFDGSAITSTQTIFNQYTSPQPRLTSDKYLAIVGTPTNIYEDNSGIFKLLKRTQFTSSISNCYSFIDKSGFLIHQSSQIYIYNYSTNQNYTLIQNLHPSSRSYAFDIADEDNLVFIHDVTIKTMYVYFKCDLSSCIQCSQPMVCETCIQGFNKNQNGVCLCNNENHVISPTTGYCIICQISNCLKCDFSNNCVECESSYTLRNNNCENSSKYLPQVILSLGCLTVVLLGSLLILQLYNMFFKKKINEQIRPYSNQNLENPSINITREHLNVQTIDIDKLKDYNQNGQRDYKTHLKKQELLQIQVIQQ